MQRLRWQLDRFGEPAVVRDGHACLTPVEVGTDNGLRVAVLRGVKRSDEVIDHPGGDVTEGAAVSVANPHPQAAAH